MHRRLSGLFTVVVIVLAIGCGDGITGQAVGESFDEPDCESLLAMLEDLRPDAADVEDASDELKAYQIMYDAVVHKCRPGESGTGDTGNN